VSGYLVDSAAFKAVGTSDPRPAGSIPVHLRHTPFRGVLEITSNSLTREDVPDGSPAFRDVRGL
jgi:hypothetical protein